MIVESYKIKGWKKKVTGLLISENEDWILIKHIPVDYVIDGFKLYHKKFIKSRKSKSKELKIVKVLSLKNINPLGPNDFNFESTIDLLKWSEKKYGLFEFQDDSESELFYGKINRVENNLLIIDNINSDGEIEKDYDYKFQIEEIRSITFETDYFESIRLLMNDEISKK